MCGPALASPYFYFMAKEVRYAPKYYTAEELGDKTKNIWDGDETVL